MIAEFFNIEKQQTLINGNRNDLAKMLGKNNFNKGVEIGTNCGEYATILCKANKNLRLTCIDPYAPYLDGHLISQEQQDKIYAKAKITLENLNAEILRIPSMVAVNQFIDNELDFVYIDGNHFFDAVMMDLIRWSSKVKKGGIVALHDYHSFRGLRTVNSFSSCRGKDVMMAIDTYTYCHNIVPWYITNEELPTAFWEKS